jgi:hypothetical protein
MRRTPPPGNPPGRGRHESGTPGTAETSDTAGKELYVMTVPEENRPKTGTTDENPEQPDDFARRRRNTEGRTMREALEDADVRPEDFEGER